VTVDASFITSVIELATNFGALGVIFWLFVTGKLHSDEDYKELREDFDAERKGHDLTRQALTLANERANSSILTSELVMRALYPPKKDDEAK
jgi:hypothetical protein